jgi:hypothetical protein
MLILHAVFDNSPGDTAGDVDAAPGSILKPPVCGMRDLSHGGSVHRTQCGGDCDRQRGTRAQADLLAAAGVAEFRCIE